MLRTSRNVSQGALARLLEVTPGYLSMVEQDKREPSLGLLNRVSEFFNIPVGFLLLGEPNKDFSPEYQRLMDEIRHAMIDYMVSRPTRKREGRGKTGLR